MKFWLKLFLIFIVGWLIIVFITLFPKSPAVPVLTRPVVSVINPIRGPQLGLDKVDLLASLKGQWKVTKDAGIRATWLWQYSAMEDAGLVTFAKSQMKDQEFGLFLETDRNSSAKSGVLYRGHGPWYFSDGLFLNGYDQEERKKLIDAAFAKFKKTFGFYPKTVGAWWIGADSLHYMQERYGVIASLQVADQYDLDVYSVWGTPWSIPYLSSKTNAAVPAQSFEKSSNIVIMQWAPRDPTYGYGNTRENSTYSMQDYELKNYDISYVDYLFSIFLKGPGDQAVVGLESGFPPESYEKTYKEKLVKIQELQKQGTLAVLPAGDFAKSFLSRKQIFGTTSYFFTKAYDSDDQSFWYNSENFRVGIEKQGENVFLVDVRNYQNPEEEDFDSLPNTQGYLRIAAPALIDSARNPSQKILLGKTKSDLRIQKKNDTIIVTDGVKSFAIVTKNSLATPEYSMTFQSQRTSLDVYLLLSILLLCYMIFFWFRQKDKAVVWIHFCILFFCFLLAKPVLSYTNINNLTMLFDPKELFVFPIINIFHLPGLWSIWIFQLTPLLLLLAAHYIFIMRKKSPRMYALCVFLFILFYSHMPNSIVTAFINHKKSAVLVIATGYIIFAFLFFLWIKFKRKNYLKTAVLGLFLGFVLLISSLAFSWQWYVITPFEMSSLQMIAAASKDVYFVTPKEIPTYRAMKPLLLKNYHYGETITNTHWESIDRIPGKLLKFTNLDNKLIFVPRYLGSELLPEEINRYKLKKIFDNSQIQIYSR